MHFRNSEITALAAAGAELVMVGEILSTNYQFVILVIGEWAIPLTSTHESVGCKILGKRYWLRCKDELAYTSRTSRVDLPDTVRYVLTCSCVHRPEIWGRETVAMRSAAVTAGPVLISSDGDGNQVAINISDLVPESR